MLNERIRSRAGRGIGLETRQDAWDAWPRPTARLASALRAEAGVDDEHTVWHSSAQGRAPGTAWSKTIIPPEGAEEYLGEESDDVSKWDTGLTRP